MPRMSREDRLDVDEAELLKPYRTAEGFLLVQGYATRAGIFEYVNDDGSIRRELRPPEEVGRADSLATLGFKPVALTHPEEDGEDGAEPVDVTPENWDQYAAGTVSPDVQFLANGYVKVSTIVGRKDAIDAIESGDAVELSCGYTADVIEERGEHPVWGRYDAIQRDIEYNHLAIVPRGRAGSTVRLRTDAACGRPVKGEMMPPVNKKPQTPAAPKPRKDESDEEILNLDPAKFDAEEYMGRMDACMTDMKGRMDEMGEAMVAQGEVLDKLLEVVEQLLPESADVEIVSEEGEMPREDQEGAEGGEMAPKRMDAADATRAAHTYYLQRRRLDSIAAALPADKKIDKQDSLANTALARALATALIPGVTAAQLKSTPYLMGVLDGHASRADAAQHKGKAGMPDLAAGRARQDGAPSFGDMNDKFKQQRDRLAGKKPPTP